MGHPRHLLETDRDIAHSTIIRCDKEAAIATVALIGPRFADTMREQRISGILHRMRRAQRERTKKNMYKQWISGNWPIDRCIDSLDASFSSHEVGELKKICCHPSFPTEAIEHVAKYDVNMH